MFAQLLVDITPGTDEENVQGRLLIVDAVDDSILTDPKRPEPDELSV